jgi:hypothetical protein
MEQNYSADCCLSTLELTFTVFASSSTKPITSKSARQTLPKPHSIFRVNISGAYPEHLSRIGSENYIVLSVSWGATHSPFTSVSTGFITPPFLNTKHTRNGPQKAKNATVNRCIGDSAINGPVTVRVASIHLLKRHAQTFTPDCGHSPMVHVCALSVLVYVDTNL